MNFLLRSVFTLVPDMNFFAHGLPCLIKFALVPDMNFFTNKLLCSPIFTLVPVMNAILK